MPRQLAHDILSLIDRAPRADDRLELSGGDDPVFPSPWRVGRAGAAALGAVGLATSDLWRLRTGRAQSVAVNLRAAAASLRSNTYVMQNGEKPVSWDPLAGHYKTRDGRTMFLHTNHPHHRAGALRISGAKVETREALAEAVAKWDGLAIEEAIADGGCVGSLVRSRDEWNAHPHGLLAVMSPTSCRRAVPSITREVIKGRFYPPSRATLRRQRSRRIPCCRLNATCSTSHATSVS